MACKNTKEKKFESLIEREIINVGFNYRYGYNNLHIPLCSLAFSAPMLERLIKRIEKARKEIFEKSF